MRLRRLAGARLATRRTRERGELGGRELEAREERRSDARGFRGGHVGRVGGEDLSLAREQAVREAVQDGCALLGGEHLQGARGAAGGEGEAA